MWSFTISLAGFLFGFDTLVITGANTNQRSVEYQSLVSWNLYNFHGTTGTGSDRCFQGKPLADFRDFSWHDIAIYLIHDARD